MRSKSARPFLSLRKATFRLGDRLIFARTSWTFCRNEHWAVVGPNGSGKSLFADALRGCLPLVHGELNYHFRPPAGLVAEEAIGHVAFEDRRADLHGAVAQSRWNSIEEEGALRVRDVLSYERVMEINPYELRKGEEKARRQFLRRQDKACRLLQIERFLDRSLLSLSNGERQRVQLARTLCHPLRLLVLDDPFVGLDSSSRQHLHHVLERLMGTALRILLITPRMDDLPRRISHVLRVEQCRITAAGKRAQLFAFLGKTSSTSPGSRTSGNDWGRAELVLPSKTKPLVDLKGVTVRYGAATILRDVGWTVYAGESWALLGPNGSGKSTLLSLIMGDNPQAYMNHVEVFGRRRGTGESIWELKRQIGSVSPELHLHFNQAVSCFEVVASGFQETIGLFEPPTVKQRRAVRHWLARFQLVEFAYTPLFALSLGQQRMVLLARALVKKPTLLVLDEPCQGLDTIHRKLFVNTLDELLRGRTVTAIYVTHRPDEIPRSITRVLRLSKKASHSGKIIAAKP
jgi:molybdate transport system ATP-binding protein